MAKTAKAPRVPHESTRVAGAPSRIGRIPILDLSPQLNDNLWPAKAFVGEVVPFAATAFREGHDLIGVALLLTAPDGTHTRHPMSLKAPGTDRFETLVRLAAQGRWEYRVHAYADDWASWEHNAAIKIPAGIDVELMFTIGAQLLASAGTDTGRPLAERRLVQAAARTLADTSLPIDTRLAVISNEKLNAAIHVRPIASL